MQLVFPEYQLQTREYEASTQVWDPARRKWIILTKEEYVRQQLILFLVLHKEIPLNRISVEKMIRYGSLRKRFDVVVYDTEGKPSILCECKAPDIPIKQDVVYQAMRYNDTLKAPYLLLTNGMSLSFFTRQSEGDFIETEFL